MVRVLDSIDQNFSALIENEYTKQAKMKNKKKKKKRKSKKKKKNIKHQEIKPL